MYNGGKKSKTMQLLVLNALLNMNMPTTEATCMFVLKAAPFRKALLHRYWRWTWSASYNNILYVVYLCYGIVVGHRMSGGDGESFRISVSVCPSARHHILQDDYFLVCICFFRMWQEMTLMKVRFQFVTTVTLKITIFWNVTPCSLVEVGQRFRGSYCFHRQYRW